MFVLSICINVKYCGVIKIELLVAGLGLTIDDLAPLELDGGVVEVVEQF